jgi:lipopolysaccharide transport system ATP-binding protein
VIDEVPAVGDAEFQKPLARCKIFPKEGGRTVLFVSHNMAAVKSCVQGNSLGAWESDV